MYSVILTIGDELTSGKISNSNARFLAEFLTDYGIENRRIVAIRDNKKEIMDGLEKIDGQVDYVFVTGGLGPTHDDVTKKTAAEFFSSELKLNQQVKERLDKFFSRLDEELAEKNYSQANLPEKAEVIPNELGTAQGMKFNENGRQYYFMPGVPGEMKQMMKKYVAAELKPPGESVYRKKTRTFGAAESEIYSQMKNWIETTEGVDISFLPQMPGVDIHLEAAEASIFEDALKDLRDKFSSIIFGYGDDAIKDLVAEKLTDRNLEVAVAESCTGGLISDTLTNVPGSSSYFKGGLVAYSNEIKTEILGVNRRTLEENGAVSKNTAEEMAENIKSKFDVDVGLSSTGIAGPGGGTENKPVGTVHIGIALEGETHGIRYHYSKDRETNKRAFMKSALINLLELVN